MTPRREDASRATRLALAGWLLLLVAGCEGALAGLLRAETIAPQDLAARLAGADPPLVLDVRTPEQLGDGHLAGALGTGCAPFAHWLASTPPPRDRPIAVVCEEGIRSLLAAALLTEQGYGPVWSLAGGVEAWRAAGLPLAPGPPSLPDPATLHPPRGTLSEGLQVLAVISGLVIKPTYMLLNLALVLLLWRRREPDLALVRRGLLLFLLGESFCAANYLVSGGGNDALDLAHDLGMVGMGVYLPWGLLRLFDERALGLLAPDARCAFQKLCGACWKRQPVACGLHRTFVLVALAGVALAVLPFTAPLRSLAQVVPVFGTDVLYAYSLELQLQNFRVFPVVAAVAFLASLVLLRGGPTRAQRAVGPFFVGLGFLSFAYFRLFLLAAFRETPVFFDFWEEATELLAIVGVGLLLLFFRGPLLRPRTHAARESAAESAAPT